MDKYWYWIEETKEQTIRILRGFGTSPVVEIPKEINKKPVTEIGAYAFADKKYTGEYTLLCWEKGREASLADDRQKEQFAHLLQQNRLVELCGKYIQKVICPDSITTLGNFAFYQCSALQELEIGKALTQIGSDAFMNCNSLHHIMVHGSVKEKTGLRQILSQRSLETLVTFLGGKNVEAKFLYPEYVETYDEIGPAHIFELTITGQGFRARQAFEQGIVDCNGYDKVFLQACFEENPITLCTMAVFRLAYPVELSQKAKKQYEDYLFAHGEMLGKELVEQEETETLEFLLAQGYLSETGVEQCLAKAVEKNKTRITALILKYEQEQKDGKEEDPYSFEEF